jgi:hypothetical protein
MRDATRAELLKARSGFWMLAVLAYALLLPLGAWNYGGKGFIVTGTDPAAATRAMLVFLVACPIAATFLGCFLVTRDYYYKSIERAVLINRKRHVFSAKLIAGVVGGLVVGVVGSAGWSVVTVFVLRDRGQGFSFGTGVWQSLLGCVVASMLAGAIGVAIGWILPNYYAATAVSLLLPFSVELPLAMTAPQVARFLPDNALAGVAQAQSQFPALFEAWPSALIVVLWLVAAAFGGWWLFERREIR